MRERRRIHDRTDHERAARQQRRGRGQRGPSTKRISDALDAVESHDVPGHPPHTELQVLKHVHDSEWNVGNRRVRDFKIANGRPLHGAMRSDDHVALYEVELPFHEVGESAVTGATCPECGGRDAAYTYKTNHQIAGYESIACQDCGEILHRNEWH